MIFNKVQSSNPFLKQLQQVQSQLGGTISNYLGASALQFDSDYAKGYYKCLPLNNNISAIDISICSSVDASISLNIPDNNLLYVIYISEGYITCKSTSFSPTLKFEALKTILVPCKIDATTTIQLKKDTTLKATFIALNSDNFFKNFIKNSSSEQSKFSTLLNKLESLELKPYLCAYNLKIASKFQAFKQNKKSNLVSDYLKTESFYLEILALQLDQVVSNILEDKPTASLSLSELQKIKNLSQYIINNPELQHSIESLCKIITMSPAKLQEGFKGMHNTTVVDFVRHIRIEKAERLLLETDLNISEIVYTIGLTSRSYFCKIFKNKYHHSPKKYRNLTRQNNAKHALLNS